MAEPAVTPVPSVPSAIANDVVVRMSWCADICGPLDATIVMRDGRVVWNQADAGIREGRLSPEGVAWVEQQLADTPVLGRSGAYDAQLRPGATPEGGGALDFEFVLDAPTGPVRVTAGIPGAADEREWIVPDELRTLVDLGGRMMTADTWIPGDMWLGAAETYEPSQYLLLVTLNPNRAKDAIDPNAVVEADEVPWPIPTPIDTATPAAPGVGDQRARCAVLDRARAELVDAAQRSAGLPGEPRPPFANRAYLWQRGGGYLTVEFQPLLPDEHDCQPAQFALD